MANKRSQARHGFGGDYARDTHIGGLGDDYARDGDWSGAGRAGDRARDVHAPEEREPVDGDRDPIGKRSE